MGSSGEWVESEIVHAIDQVMEGHHTDPTSVFYRPRRRWVRSSSSRDALNAIQSVTHHRTMDKKLSRWE